MPLHEQRNSTRRLYSSVEKKAANLIYFLIKNYDVVVGNKLNAAALFFALLDRSGALPTWQK
jgi:hypothetical protein